MFIGNRKILVGLVFAGTLLRAQTPPPPITASDPGLRPAGIHAGFNVPDTHGNIIPDFVQPNDATKNSAGNFLPNLTGDQTTFWFDALAIFGDIASVKGAPSTEPIVGLGPAFNGSSCFMCHSQPAIGGSSPGPGTPLFTENPQIIAASDRGATNTIPSFITPSGPVREARFVQNADGSLDGSVHELFIIKGRDDTPATCAIKQPDFQTQISNNNLILRIPIPTFGEGFVENTTDATLQSNLAALAAQKTALGIKGRFNTNGNDGTITRFGWKAQNKSLLLFAGEATNVEMGVTNELFPSEKVPGQGCATNNLPEDLTNIVPLATLTKEANAGAAASAVSSEIENFTVFMRFNAAPAQCDFASGLDANGNAICKPLGALAQHGRDLFGVPTAAVPNAVSCILCHSSHLVTAPSPFIDLSSAEFHPFSDFALHHMGSNLADGVNQGQAVADEFRTAPLWGLGQRIFFLHDGRTSDLLAAIQAHFSPVTDCTTVNTLSETFVLAGQSKSVPSTTASFCGSEANAVVNSFNALGDGDKQALVDFLRSL